MSGSNEDMKSSISKSIKAIQEERWEEALGLLCTYTGNDPLADYLTGLIYYCRYNNLDEARICFSRVFSCERTGIDEYRARSAEFLGHINWEQSRMQDAEENILQAIAYGNPDCFLEAAYLLLHHHDPKKRDLALTFAREGEMILSDEDDMEIKASGFHIVASVYLWGNLYNDAHRVSKWFLKDYDYRINNRDQVEEYLYMLVSKGQEKIIDKTFNNYGLKKSFSNLYKAYQFLSGKIVEDNVDNEIAGVLTRIERVGRDFS
ncbi:MAG: hypothetical protein N4A72_14370 [Bacteroidales bacterium]|jgi:hypothetical protein|nr:hypothetical protein [Bacteroidales bacterium]